MRLADKMTALVFKAKMKAYNFMHDEKGDTNFISILVLLGIALALAGVFLAFKDSIIGWVNDNIGGFFEKDGGNNTPIKGPNQPT